MGRRMLVVVPALRRCSLLARVLLRGHDCFLGRASCCQIAQLCVWEVETRLLPLIGALRVTPPACCARPERWEQSSAEYGSNSLPLGRGLEKSERGREGQIERERVRRCACVCTSSSAVPSSREPEILQCHKISKKQNLHFCDRSFRRNTLPHKNKDYHTQNGIISPDLDDLSGNCLATTFR